MLTIIFDVLRWLLSKLLVVLVIAVATVVVTLAVQYHSEQERLLTEKDAKSKELEQLRRKVAQAMGLRRAAEEQLKSVNDRLAKPQEELEAIKKKLAANSPSIAAVQKQISSLKEQAAAKARAASAVRQDLFSRRAILRELEKTEPSKYPNLIGYWMWRLKWDPAVAAYNESVELEAAAAAAVKRNTEELAKAARSLAQLSELGAHDKARLLELEAQISTILPDKEKAAQELERADHQVQELRASEKTALEVLADMAGRVRWYENARAEVLRAFDSSRTTIVGLVVLVFLGPAALKVFWFYVIARFAAAAPVLRYETDESGSAVAVAEGRTLDAPLSKEQDLASRPDWVKSWPPIARRRTKALWDWHAVIISYVAGLRELTCFTVDDEGVVTTVTLGAGDDPNRHLFRLDLEDHPGFVLRPDRVVAISGNLQVRTKWNFSNLNTWVSGSFRKILFHGTGTLYIWGYGGVTAIDCGKGSRNVEEDFVIGYDSRSAFRTVRTETFWPYFRNKASLFDYAFGGPGLTLTETAIAPGSKASSNPLKRTLDAIFNAIGKLLGF